MADDVVAVDLDVVEGGLRVVEAYDGGVRAYFVNRGVGLGVGHCGTGQLGGNGSALVAVDVVPYLAVSGGFAG